MTRRDGSAARKAGTSGRVYVCRLTDLLRTEAVVAPWLMLHIGR
jgi:hypothetical protein